MVNIGKYTSPMDPMGTRLFRCQVAQRYRLRPSSPGVAEVFCPNDKAGNGSVFSSDHQLSLVVYPVIYKVLYISGGFFSPDF